jgi:hypothetical protein
MSLRYANRDLRKFVREMTAVQRDFIHLAFRRLRLGHAPTPAEIEGAMRLIDSGALDGMLESGSPPVQSAGVERYADIHPFDHEVWKRRHDAKE